MAHRRPASGPNAWLDLSALMAQGDFAQHYMPEEWRNPPEALKNADHGGGDFFVIYDFLRAIRGQIPCPIGIHEAMDMTLPGLASQTSIAEGGRWVDVPDSREWATV